MLGCWVVGLVGRFGGVLRCCVLGLVLGVGCLGGEASGWAVGRLGGWVLCVGVLGGWVVTIVVREVFGFVKVLILF